MTGIARIDGKPYVFLGAPRTGDGGAFGPQMTQTKLTVTPTQSRYQLQRERRDTDAGLFVAGRAE